MRQTSFPGENGEKTGFFPDKKTQAQVFADGIESQRRPTT
jgi:hypothetical protein